jgi:hypothetical protein
MKNLARAVMVCSVGFAFSFPAMADEVDDACGGSRQSMLAQRKRCEAEKPQDRGICLQKDLRPLENSYATCIRNFNDRAKARAKKNDQAPTPKPSGTSF